jgi:hypothetical protein
MVSWYALFSWELSPGANISLCSQKSTVSVKLSGGNRSLWGKLTFLVLKCGFCQFVGLGLRFRLRAFVKITEVVVSVVDLVYQI